MKMAFAVVAFAAVGLGSYKAYGSYTAANMSEEDLLLAENVEALSDPEGTRGDNEDMFFYRQSVIGYCWEQKKSYKECPLRNEKGHTASCYNETESYSLHHIMYNRAVVYSYQTAYASIKSSSQEWVEGDDACYCGKSTKENVAPQSKSRHYMN